MWQPGNYDLKPGNLIVMNTSVACWKIPNTKNLKQFGFSPIQMIILKAGTVGVLIMETDDFASLAGFWAVLVNGCLVEIHKNCMEPLH